MAVSYYIYGMSQKNIFHGVVIYDIIMNANVLVLNGVYSNVGSPKATYLAFKIHNEIAKRIIKNETDIQDEDILIGKYDMRYIDSELVDGKLIIRRKEEVYELEWLVEDKLLFKGIGLMSGDDRLAVSYVDA